MPPKSAQKVAVADQGTPKPKPKKRKAEETLEEDPTPTPKKRVKKDPPVYQSLQQDSRATIPIDVSVEGGLMNAKHEKDGTFSMTLKLKASDVFQPVTTLTFTDGEFEGMQAIIIKPAKAFPFMSLPDTIRRRIYKFYLAPNGVCNNVIVLEARRVNKDVWAKSYSEGSKYRVGLLTANKKIREEATPILYEHGLRLENTGSWVDFIFCGADSMKANIVNVEIKTWVKTQSRFAFTGFASCTNLTRLHVDAGLFSEEDPVKAAKSFWAEGSKFLEAANARMGGNGAGVDVLSFGRQALVVKEGKGEAKAWNKDMKEEFVEALREKLK